MKWCAHSCCRSTHSRRFSAACAGPTYADTKIWVAPSGIGAGGAGIGGTLATDGVIEDTGDLCAFKDTYKEQFQAVEANAGGMPSLRVDVNAFFVLLVLSTRSPFFVFRFCVSWEDTTEWCAITYPRTGTYPLFGTPLNTQHFHCFIIHILVLVLYIHL